MIKKSGNKGIISSAIGICFIILMFLPSSGISEEMKMSHDTLVQAMFGISILEKDDTDLDNSNDTITSDVSTFPILGIMGQIPVVSGSKLMAGFEGGGELSWWRDDAKVVNSGGVTVLYLKNKMMMGNLLMGGFISTDPEASVRFYAGAGATMNWGRMEVDSDNSDSGDDTFINETESSFGYGGYIRCGVDFMVADGLVGIVGKATASKIDFESSCSREDYNGFQIMMTYTAPISSLGLDF